MRKPKKKLFRRGEQQKYQKTRTYYRKSKHATDNNTASLHFPFFRMFLLFAFIATITLLWPLIFRNLQPIIAETDFTKFMPTFSFPSITLPDLSKLFHLDVPQIRIKPLEFPKFDVPIPAVPVTKLKTPQFSIDFSPIQTVIQSTFSFLYTFSLTIITVLNPQPLISSLSRLFSQGASYITAAIQAVFNMAAYTITYLDPRPGTVIIFQGFIGLSKLIYSLCIQIISYMNPLPIMVRTWEIEAIAITEVYYVFVIFLLSVLSSLMTIITTVAFAIVTIVNIIISFIISVYNAIAGFLYSIYRGIAGIIDGIHKQFVLVGKFLNPYITLFVNVFNQMMRDSYDALKELFSFINSIVNDYNQAQQKL